MSIEENRQTRIKNPDLKYKRILLKLSGEALMGNQDFGIDMKFVDQIATEIKTAWQNGAEICLVIGGGNIFRGMSGAAQGMNRSSADYMGMLATVMNALAMANALEELDIPTRVLSAIPMPTVCEPFVGPRARAHLGKGRVVIFAAGTGNPFFTTDTGAALRAAEMGCDALLKATQVDGVYDKDPNKYSDAVKFDQVSFTDVLAKDLKVMDAAAIALARDNDIPIIVYSMTQKEGLMGILKGEGSFTIVNSGNMS
ncbi:MAG: UMP kinase [Rhizobiales bacterium]|nr:UMP kinase [Hyphomicrobiales bacterium]